MLCGKGKFDPPTSGLWAKHASSAPFRCLNGRIFVNKSLVNYQAWTIICKMTKYLLCLFIEFNYFSFIFGFIRKRKSLPFQKHISIVKSFWLITNTILRFDWFLCFFTYSLHCKLVMNEWISFFNNLTRKTPKPTSVVPEICLKNRYS